MWVNTLGPSWNITYDSIQNKFTFYNTSSFTFTDDVGTNNKLKIPSSLFYIIGLVDRKSYTSLFNSSTSKYYLTSECCIDFTSFLKLNINTSSFNLNNYDSYNRGVCSTICSVPVNSIQNGVIFYNNYTQYRSNFRNTILLDININIQDEYENFIDFHNLDWSITIQIDVVTKHKQTLDGMEDIYENYINNN